jgi:hypothetical protein
MNDKDSFLKVIKKKKKTQGSKVSIKKHRGVIFNQIKPRTQLFVCYLEGIQALVYASQNSPHTDLQNQALKLPSRERKRAYSKELLSLYI